MTTLNETVQNLVINNAEIDSYFATVDNEEVAKIKSPKAYADTIMDYFTEDVNGGIPLPFDSAYGKFAVRNGEVSIVTGYSGHGKTAWLSYVVYNMLKEHKCLIASFEMQPRATLGRMIQQTGNPEPTQSTINDFINEINDNLFLYDAEGETSPAKVLAVLHYARKKLGVEVFVIDSLMKLGINGDDYNAQKSMINKLCTFARDNGSHIFLVAHSRKTMNEYGSPSKFDVMGSSDITNLADNCITVFRNKKKEELINKGEDDEETMNMKDCYIYINKQRHGTGWEGSIGLYFDNRTFRYGERKLDSKSIFKKHDMGF
tara:strand:- start:717 stop:1667 length:951 start_codon:yes stop_codon:yes gene_type:complete